MTDSELVPWGKGEKQPGEGDEIDPETIRLQRAGARKGDRVPIEEWANDFIGTAWVNLVWGGPVGKPSLNRAFLSFL